MTAEMQKVVQEMQKRHGAVVTARAMKLLDKAAAQYSDSFELSEFIRSKRGASRSWYVATEIFARTLLALMASARIAKEKT